MRRSIAFSYFVVFALMLFFSSHAHASLVVDQSQSVVNNLALHAPVTNRVAQSFMPSFDNIVGVRIGLGQGQLDSVSVGLYQQINSGTSSLLQDVNGNDAFATTMSNLSPSTSTSDVNYAQIDFGASVMLDIGNTYYLVFEGTFTGSPSFNRSFAGHDDGGTGTGNYAAGSVFTSPLTSNPVVQPNLDLAFATLSSDVTAVPEPSSALMFLGSLLLIGMRRRR
ncbi:MAG: PEP-CTERM sorting domain-containing protein [Pirellulaceae bacterium]